MPLNFFKEKETTQQNGLEFLLSLKNENKTGLRSFVLFNVGFFEDTLCDSRYTIIFLLPISTHKAENYH